MSLLLHPTPVHFLFFNSHKTLAFPNVILLLILAVFLCLASPVKAFDESESSAVILQYHHVSTETPAITSISPELFEQHLAYIKEQQFNVISLLDLITMLRDKTPIPNKSVVITFDDAYRSVYEEAWPRLKRYNYPFTVFVNTGFVTGQSANASFNLALPEGGHKYALTWSQLKEMADQGVTLANHTVTHLHMIRSLQNETSTQWLARLTREIDHAESTLVKQVAQGHKALAYPFGEYTQSIQSLLASKGYVALAQQSGAVTHDSDLQALPRFAFGGVYTDLSGFKTKVNALSLPVSESKAYVDGHQVADSILSHNSGIPEVQLSVQLSENQARRITCYASGQGRVEAQYQFKDSGVGVLTVSLEQQVPVGRSRINCTLPSKWSGRYYWYSHQLIRKAKDDLWYKE
jgi:peptidoglycan/xylan/chitin deacetylase (PgdA/CDA1 family)